MVLSIPSEQTPLSNNISKHGLFLLKRFITAGNARAVFCKYTYACIQTSTGA